MEHFDESWKSDIIEVPGAFEQAKLTSGKKKESQLFKNWMHRIMTNGLFNCEHSEQALPQDQS